MKKGVKDKITYVDGWAEGTIDEARHIYESEDGSIHINLTFRDQGKDSQYRWIVFAKHRGKTVKHSLGKTKAKAVVCLKQSLSMDIAKAEAELDLLKAVQYTALTYLSQEDGNETLF